MTPEPNRLDDDLVGEVLRGLGIEQPTIDRAGLAQLYSAWCRSVPFDNVRKLIALDAGDAALPQMDASMFLSEWLADGAGGTCWASNNGLHSLLSALGFRAEVWAASMFDTEANHATTLVSFEDGALLVDTAVHGDVPLPVPVEDGQSAHVDFHGYRTAARHDGRGVVMAFPTPDPDFSIPCRVLEPVDYTATVEANERTRGWSPFNEAVMAGINDADGVWMLNGSDLTRIDASGRETRSVSDADADAFLVDVAGCAPSIVADMRRALR